MGRTLLEGRKLKPDFKIKCEKLRHALEGCEMMNMKDVQALQMTTLPCLPTVPVSLQILN